MINVGKTNMQSQFLLWSVLDWDHFINMINFFISTVDGWGSGLATPGLSSLVCDCVGGRISVSWLCQLCFLQAPPPLSLSNNTNQLVLEPAGAATRGNCRAQQGAVQIQH